MHILAAKLRSAFAVTDSTAHLRWSLAAPNCTKRDKPKSLRIAVSCHPVLDTGSSIKRMLITLVSGQTGNDMGFEAQVTNILEICGI